MLIIRTMLDSHSNKSNYQYPNLHYFCPKNDRSDMIKDRPDCTPSGHLQVQCYSQFLVVGRIRLPRSSGTLEDGRVLGWEKGSNCGPTAAERWLSQREMAKKGGLSSYYIV